MSRPVHPPVLITADSETDYVYPPPRRIRPAGLAVTVWATRLLFTVSLGALGWDTYHFVRKIWMAATGQTVPLGLSLLPWWTLAALLVTSAVLSVGWFAFGDQNEWPSETWHRVRQQPDVGHWAHQRA